MKKVCCVCGKDPGEVAGPPGRLTHGFCEKCYHSELRAREARTDAPKGAESPPRPPCKPSPS